MTIKNFNYKSTITVKKAIEPVASIGAIAVLLVQLAGLDEQTSAAIALLVYGLFNGLRNWIKNRTI